MCGGITPPRTVSIVRLSGENRGERCWVDVLDRRIEQYIYARVGIIAVDDIIIYYTRKTLNVLHV